MLVEEGNSFRRDRDVWAIVDEGGTVFEIGGADPRDGGRFLGNGTALVEDGRAIVVENGRAVIGNG